MSDDLRSQIIMRLQQLANRPRKSRTQQELEEARQLLDVLKLKHEIQEFPKKSWFDRLSSSFDLAKLNEEIDDFKDPKRQYVKQLRSEVEVRKLEKELEALKGPRKPIPWVAIGVGCLILFFGSLLALPKEQMERTIDQLSLPIVLLAAGIWGLHKLNKKKP